MRRPWWSRWRRRLRVPEQRTPRTPVIVNTDVAIENGANADRRRRHHRHRRALVHPELRRHRPLRARDLRATATSSAWCATRTTGRTAPRSRGRHTRAAGRRDPGPVLQTGDADIAMQIDPTPPRRIDSADSVIESIPSFNFLYLGLSRDPGDDRCPSTTEIREAITLAIDYQEIIDYRSLVRADAGLADPQRVPGSRRPHPCPATISRGPGRCSTRQGWVTA